MKIRKHEYIIAIKILIAIIFFIVSVSLILSSYLTHKIKNIEIDGFTLESQSAHVSLIKRTVNLSQLKIQDSAKLATLTIDKITIDRVHIFNLLFNSNFYMESLSLENPHLHLDTAFFSNNPLQKKDRKKNKTPKIFIKGTNINDAHLLFVSSKGDDKDTLLYTQLSMKINELKRDGKLSIYNYKGTSFDRIELSLMSGILKFSDGLYSFEYDSILYDSDQMDLNINKLQLNSKYSRYRIGEHTGFETDWFDFTFKKFSLQKIQLETLLNHSALVISEGRVGSFKASAFKDKRLPFPDKPDTKLPIDMLLSLPLGLHCDSFFIDSAYVEYAERVDDSEKPGMVYFDHLSAQIIQISNIDSLISKPTTMQAEGRVMGEALMKAHFTFPNSKYPGLYRAYGRMASMPITSFNPILNQNVFVNAQKGNIKGLSFDFSYGNNISNGKLIFEYDNLKISILDKDDLQKQDFPSFVVNHLVLHKKNLQSDKNFREGTIHFERNKKRSVFNYWWKSILSGLKTIAVF